VEELIKDIVPMEQEEVFELPEDLEERRRMFIGMGGKASWKEFQKAEHAAQERAKKRADEARAANPFASASSRIGASIAGISVRFIEIVFRFGLPVGLILVLVAEGAAITEGVSIFAPNSALLYSGALMVFLFVILFVSEVVHRSGLETQAEIFSIRSLFGRLSYTVGIGRKGWRPQYKQATTPMLIVESATLAVSRSIIFFGILGRLKISLDATKQTNWIEGIRQVVINSNLETMMGYIGNILLAMTLLSSAHVVVYLIHRFYVLSTGGLDIASDNALGFLATVSEEVFLEQELKQFYADQIYLLKAHNEKQSLLTAPTSFSEKS